MLSRVSLRAVLVAAVVSVIAGGLTMRSAMADNPTAADLQTQIIEQRQQINALYMQASAANERVNGANLALDEAEAALKKHKAVLKKATQEYGEQSKVVAEMTVEQQLYGSTDQAKMSLLDGREASEVLEEVTGLQAIDEAMTAELDRLDAGQTVLDSASASVENVVADRKKAVADRKAARAQITTAIKQAEALEAQMAADRDGIIAQLAKAQNKSVAQVEREVEQIEEQVDQSGPGVPVEPNPQPTTPKPTTPKPTTPAPTTPAPTNPPPTTPDPKPSSKVETAIAYAQAQLGEPYKWGGAGPSSWDCSGLVMKAYGAAGIKLSHYAPTQFTAGTKVSVNSIKRGDLLFWSNGSVSSIYHVAIYLGNGKMIHAPRTGRNVEIVSVSYWIKPDMAARF